MNTVPQTIIVATFPSVILSPLSALARGGGRGRGGGHCSGSHSRSYHSGSRSHGSHSGGGHKSTAPGVKRDSHGKIKRSEEAKKIHEAVRLSARLAGIHSRLHRAAEARNSDTPSNMQWQTKKKRQRKRKGQNKHTCAPRY